MLKIFLFSCFEYFQIWINILIDDHHLSNITIFIKKIADSHHTKHHASTNDARCSMSFIFRHLHRCSICTRVILLLTSKTSHLFFPNPTHKTEIGRRLLIATDLHKSNNLANQKQVLSFALPFASLSIVYQKKNGGLQPICRAKLACFEFSSSKILHPKP